MSKVPVTHAVEDREDFRRLMADAIGTDNMELVGLAVGGGRSADRYHRFRMGSRRAAKAVGPGDDIASYPREYGINLGRGAIVMLVEEAGKPVVRVQHILHFGLPGVTPDMLRGDVDIPTLNKRLTHTEWHDTERPKADMHHLATRALGPLPDDLAHAMFPKPLSAGGDAYALATRTFANWLGGLPLPEPLLPEEPGTPDVPSRRTSNWLPLSLPSITGGVASPLAVLRSLWSSMSSGLTAGSNGGEEGGEDAAGGGSVPSTPRDAGGGEAMEVEPMAEPMAEQEPRMSMAEAWAEYERRIRERGPTYNDEVEREWFESYLFHDQHGYGAMARKDDEVVRNAAGQDISVLLDAP